MAKKTLSSLLKSEKSDVKKPLSSIRDAKTSIIVTCRFSELEVAMLDRIVDDWNRTPGRGYYDQVKRSSMLAKLIDLQHTAVMKKSVKQHSTSKK